MKLSNYLTKYLIVENAKDYAATQDRLLFCEYLTDLPFESKILDSFDEKMWEYACDLGLCKKIN